MFQLRVVEEIKTRFMFILILEANKMHYFSTLFW